MARAVGVSPSAFRKWLKGEAEPSRERLVALSDAAGVPVGWLAKGEGTPPDLAAAPPGQRSGRTAREVRSVELEQFLLLPKRPEAAAAGSATPAPPDRTTAEYVAFRHDWIRASFHIDPGELVLEIAVGDSMQPTLDDGDLLLVDTSERNLGHFGIFVLEVRGERLVKRIQRKLDGTVVLISDNPAYGEDVVSADAANGLTVIGRVVWSGGAI